MKHWTRIPLLVGLSLTCAFLLNLPAEVQACMGNNPCSGCPSGCSCTTDGSSTTCDCSNQVFLASPLPTIVNFLGHRRAQIIVRGYKTTHLQPLTSCVTALSPVEGIERVNSVTNHDSTTGRRFKEVAFFPSERPGQEVALLANEEGMPLGDQESWFGFQSKITGTVADDVANHFVIDVTLKEGVSPEAFVQALRAQGVFATSSSTPDGVPNRGHHYFRRLASMDVLALYPKRPMPPQRRLP
jgi:hypothetical protein